jgi:hypothetical protein
LLELTIYDLARHLIGEQRRPLTLDLAPHALANPAPSIWAAWMGHFEHVGNQYIPLPDLTRESLRLAIGERERALAADGRAIEFLRRIGDRLAAHQTVRECWQPEELLALRRAVEGAKEQVA